MQRYVAVVMVVGLLAGGMSAQVQADQSQSSSAVRQSVDDAWWTGPMLAPSAATLPRGHFLVEPYLYDVRSAHSNGLGSLTYINYGLANNVTVGLIPTAGYNVVSNGRSSSGVELGDLTLQAQLRIMKFHEGGLIPTTSFAVQESLPTGKYDRLGNRPSDGLGSGACTTTLAIYSQTYFWLPNRRILRVRLNLSESLSNDANVKDVSVYGTGTGFRGKASPGRSFYVDASWEYSLTRRWVLALDTTYRHNGNTRVLGYDTQNPDGAQNAASIRLNSGSSEVFALAPAIEYSWKPTIGVLIGTRLIPASHHTAATVTPAVAINFVH